MCVYMTHVCAWRLKEDITSSGGGVTESCRYPRQALQKDFPSSLTKRVIHT